MTQTEALDILKTGANVFLTGEPGSGKTYTVNQYIAWLRRHGIEPAITASTGIAATHSNGHTIHSWSGIGVREYLTPYDLDKITQDERRSKRIRSTKVLIIDEVSMLSSSVLTMIDQVMRTVRDSSDPFGGLQIVLVGDFFQLPPIQKNSDADSAHSYEAMIEFETGETRKSGKQFAFASPSWSAARFVTCYLSEQHRQEDDAFLEILTAIRRGKVTASHRELLRGRMREKGAEGTTALYSHNVDVDRINENELKKLPGIPRSFSMTGKGAKHLIEQLKRGCLSPEQLYLKIGAKVMFTKNNFEEGFVNGTLGTVLEFRDGSPIVETRSGKKIVVPMMEWSVTDGPKILAQVKQFPLRLAWAITVHKSQGMSLDAAHMDLSKTFEYGQGYVALSRVRTLSGVSMEGLNERALQIHPDIYAEDIAFKKDSAAAKAAFSAMSKEEIQTMQHNFIKACGGTLSPSKAAFKRAIAAKSSKKESTLEITKKLIEKGYSLKKIAETREIGEGTILEHMEKLYTAKKINLADLRRTLGGRDSSFGKIFSAFKIHGTEKLKPVFEYLGGKVDYDTLKIARLLYEK